MFSVYHVQKQVSKTYDIHRQHNYIASHHENINFFHISLAYMQLFKLIYRIGMEATL